MQPCTIAESAYKPEQCKSACSLASIVKIYIQAKISKLAKKHRYFHLFYANHYPPDMYLYLHNPSRIRSKQIHPVKSSTTSVYSCHKQARVFYTYRAPIVHVTRLCIRKQVPNHNYSTKQKQCRCLHAHVHTPTFASTVFCPRTKLPSRNEVRIL